MNDMTVNVPQLKLQVVAVVFSELEVNPKEYYYFAPLEAKQSQYAVVYSERSQSEFPFKIVRIVRDNVIDSDRRANRSIWATFDEGFAKQVQEHSERLGRIRAQLESKKRQFQEQEMFRVMAQTDPEVATLLEELNSFGSFNGAQ